MERHSLVTPILNTTVHLLLTQVKTHNKDTKRTTFFHFNRFGQEREASSKPLFKKQTLLLFSFNRYCLDRYTSKRKRAVERNSIDICILVLDGKLASKTVEASTSRDSQGQKVLW